MTGRNDVYRWRAFEQGGKIFRAIGRRVHPDPAQLTGRYTHKQLVISKGDRSYGPTGGFCD